MTTMTNMVLNNSYWNNNSPNQLFDFDDLFSSTFDLIYNHHSTSIKDEYEEISESNMDSQMDTSPTESQFTDLVCGVCSAPAHGYNFDQITCESCKAFFRRNALRSMSDLKCRFSGECVININTRRHCTHCRLKKCFGIKMRKDWIRTDEEREIRQLHKIAKEQKKLNQLSNHQQSLVNLPLVVRKKKRLLIKPNVQSMFTQRFFGFNRNLSDEDHILLNNITNTHQSVVDQIVKKNTPPPTLIEFLNQESPVHESLIKFYKYIPQFKELNIDDQVYLIKYNLIKIVHLHGILIEKFQENPLMGVYMSKWIGEEFHHQMSRTRRYFDRFVEHPLVLQLALIVLIFSINLSTICDTAQSEFCVNDKEICKIQNFYTTLLWRYLNTIYEEKDAIRSMAIITTQILRYQTLMNEMEEIIRRETHPVNQLESSLFRLP